jgi:AAA family ATP:ADP antiporter
MLNTKIVRGDVCHAKHRALRSLEIRAAFLFVNFLLIIMALYQLKPASRSLFIGEIGANGLPYVWIGTATVMGAVIALYHRIVERYDGYRVVLGTLLLCAALLALFWGLLQRPSGPVTVAFYIFVDILGVILVEQFWSLTNSIYTTHEGRGWYGLVGTGGLIGGVAGSAAAAAFIKTTRLETVDLLLVAAAILSIIVLLSVLMGRLGLYCEIEQARKVAPPSGWRALTRSRYLLLIASILLLAQLASPLIEFQFLKTVEGAYREQEARTAFLSLFFGLMGIVSIGVNLVLTPVIHRTLGVIAGLLVQPLMMALCSFGFLFHPTVIMGSVTKISDRGLSYSINRASKELLYVPVNPVLIYQAKAWIDMFGYRMFKVFSSLIILLLTQWLPFKVNVPQLSWLIVGLCMVWIGILIALRSDYRFYASS